MGCEVVNAHVGFFCVKKKGDKQRLIVDCRQADYLMRLPPKTRLGSAAAMTALRLSDAEMAPEDSDAVDLEYDSRNPFVLCALSMVPIYKGSPSISCPYCAAKYLPEHAGKQCAVCKAGKIGGQGAGLLISRKYNTGRRR